ncbi:hypothetical protein AGMMS49992_28080 [Clostridia bacterium]|nr:hypothetical protein AGMMS49992_28080 [Clostridia bacterium]
MRIELEVDSVFELLSVLASALLSVLASALLSVWELVMELFYLRHKFLVYSVSPRFSTID